MAVLDNADLFDLAVKQKLIGASLYLDDDTSKVVEDFSLNMAIDQICIKFTDGKQNFFNFREKFKVDTVEVVTIIRKGKVKMHKKNK